MSYTDTASTFPGSDAPSRQAPVAVDPDRITMAVILARMTEFFDFFVYAIASVLVFPYVFFSFADPLTATLYSFAVFSLAFIARRYNPDLDVIVTSGSPLPRPLPQGAKYWAKPWAPLDVIRLAEQTAHRLYVQLPDAPGGQGRERRH